MRTVLVALLVALGTPFGALGASLVFDFEDGLQGWETSGSVTRVPTQVLGGSYAIFGDGRFAPQIPDFMCPDTPSGGPIGIGCGVLPVNRLVIEADAIASPDVISIEFVYSGSSDLGSPANFFEVRIRSEDNPRSRAMPRISVDTTETRFGIAFFDVSALIPGDTLEIEWRFRPLDCGSDSVGGCSAQDASIGFIDNIAFLPEPSGVLLMVLVGIGGVVRRRV